MNEIHYNTLQALRGCSMLPGSWDKRIVRHWSEWPPGHELTAKQVFWIEALGWKYRKQLGGIPEEWAVYREVWAREEQTGLTPEQIKNWWIAEPTGASDE